MRSTDLAYSITLGGLEGAERLIAAWNERQARRMSLLLAPKIGPALTPRCWSMWVRFPARRTTQAADLRVLDRHRTARI
jgi:hypothetical protein